MDILDRSIQSGGGGGGGGRLALCVCTCVCVGGGGGGHVSGYECVRGSVSLDGALHCGKHICVIVLNVS